MIKHFSNSQLEMYQRCPRQYYFRYIKGLKIPPSGSLTLGKSVHKGLSKNFSQKIDTEKDLPLPDILDSYSTEFDYWKTITEWEGEAPGEVKDEGVELLSLHRQKRCPKILPALSEQMIRIAIPGIDNIEFVSVFDVVDVRKSIIDFKVSGKTPPEATIQKSHQLTAYCWAFRTFFQEEESRVQLDYLIRTKIKKLLTLEAIRTEEEINIFLENTRDVLGAIQKGIFPRCNPGGNYLCSPKFCGYFEKCKPYTVQILIEGGKNAKTK